MFNSFGDFECVSRKGQNSHIAKWIETYFRKRMVYFVNTDFSLENVHCISFKNNFENNSPSSIVSNVNGNKTSKAFERD